MDIKSRLAGCTALCREKADARQSQVCQLVASVFSQLMTRWRCRARIRSVLGTGRKVSAGLPAAGGDRLAEGGSRIAVSLMCTVFMLGGCVTAYPRADEVASLGVDAARTGQHAGETVRWGGTIVDVRNTDSGTRLQILSRPLRANGRPVRDDRSDGRFIAQVAAFLDPEIYKPGRDISVTGTIGPVESGSVGEASYTFATLDVDKYQYWKPEPPVVKLPPGYYPNPIFLPPSDWPFDYYRHRPLPRPARSTERSVSGDGEAAGN